MFQQLLQMTAALWPFMLLVAAIAYLLGSVNFAILITRRVAKQDIRELGSGNAGMTNVLRSQGKIPAVFTTLGDVGKSLLAGFVGGWILRAAYAGGDMTPYQVEVAGRYLAGLCCTLGHTFPVFFGFRGGKGVLVAFGMLITADWRIALPVLGVFILVVAIWRMVSLGSLCGAASAIPITWCVDRYLAGWDNGTALAATVITAVVVSILFIMHRGNIQRLIAGNERKLSFGKKEG